MNLDVHRPTSIRLHKCPAVTTTTTEVDVATITTEGVETIVNQVEEKIDTTMTGEGMMIGAGEMSQMTGSASEAEVETGIGRTGKGGTVVKAERGARRRTRKTGQCFEASMLCMT